MDEKYTRFWKHIKAKVLEYRRPDSPLTIKSSMLDGLIYIAESIRQSKKCDRENCAECAEFFSEEGKKILALIEARLLKIYDYLMAKWQKTNPERNIEHKGYIMYQNLNARMFLVENDYAAGSIEKEDALIKINALLNERATVAESTLLLLKLLMPKEAFQQALVQKIPTNANVTVQPANTKNVANKNLN